MSHLPHVFAYKQALIEQGITCPVKLANLVNEPFANAIMRDHFKRSEHLGISEAQENRLWAKLDCWNKISPINAQLIFQTVKARLNMTRAELLRKGTLPATKFTQLEPVGETAVDVAQNAKFEELVEFLCAELVNCNE